MRDNPSTGCVWRKITARITPRRLHVCQITKPLWMFVAIIIENSINRFYGIGIEVTRIALDGVNEELSTVAGV